MALPEDDVEEVEPDDALARILDHEHDALVLGPGLRPGLATVELIRRLLAVDDEGTPPAVVDAEALRSLAAVDDWWLGVHRSCVLTPHTGEFARLRAASGIAAECRRRPARRRCRPGRRRSRRRPALEPGRGPEGRPDGDRRARTAGSPGRRSRTRRWRRGGTGDVLSGTIGALLAQHLEPFTRRPPGRLPARHRRRVDPRPAGRRRPAGVGPALRDRPGPQAPRGGPGAPDGRAQARLRRPSRAGAQAEPARRPAAGRPRLGAGRGPAAPDGLAGDRPRPPGANLAILRAAIPAGTRLDVVLKADAYGHGAVPIGRALEAASPTPASPARRPGGRHVRRGRRAARGGPEPADPRALPDPAGACRRGRPAADRRDRRRRGPPRADPGRDRGRPRLGPGRRPAPGAPPARGPPRARDRPRAGRAAARAGGRRGRPDRRRARRSPRRDLVPPPGAGRRGPDDRPGGPLPGRDGAPRRGRDPDPAAPPDRERRPAGRQRAAPRRRPDRPGAVRPAARRPAGRSAGRLGWPPGSCRCSRCMPGRSG